MLKLIRDVTLRLTRNTSEILYIQET